MILLTKALIFVLWIDLFNKVHIATGLARFTNVPPSVLYVSVGRTARFAWDYTVDNRTNDFQESSPTWSFYWSNSSESMIGHEKVFEQQRWTINYKTCPKRLLQPTRVSRESNATLVIHNVTTDDSGTYGCSLLLTTLDPITSKINLVVTTIPKIIIAENTTIRINESDSLDISCSATGSPTPNVSWVNALNSIMMSEGGGNATLRIKNITILQGGVYKCRASNNPHEAPVTMDIEILVQFKPHIDIVKSTKAAVSTRNKNISLQCVAPGQPLPKFTWYDPRGRQIVSGIDNKRERSVLNFETKNSSDFGQYKCTAKNAVGKDEHFIDVMQLLIPTVYPIIQKKGTKHTTRKRTPRFPKRAFTQAAMPSERKPKIMKPLVGAIIGVGLLIAFGLMAFIVKKTCISKKKNEANKRNTNQSSRNNGCPLDIHEAYDRETPIYAEVDDSMKMAIMLDNGNKVPIYAQVDKSKKKRPGQIIYAELEDLKHHEEKSGVAFPPEYTGTEYAAIQSLSGQANNEPTYERL